MGRAGFLICLFAATFMLNACVPTAHRDGSEDPQVRILGFFSYGNEFFTDQAFAAAGPTITDKAAARLLGPGR